MSPYEDWQAPGMGRRVCVLVLLTILLIDTLASRKPA